MPAHEARDQARCSLLVIISEPAHVSAWLICWRDWMCFNCKHGCMRLSMTSH